MPPSMEELKKRLENRKTESQEKILARFKTAYQEINEVTKDINNMNKANKMVPGRKVFTSTHRIS